MSNVGDDIIKGMQEALAHASGEANNAVVRRVKLADIDVKGIRTHLQLTQDQMSGFLGVSVSGYRKWEQKARRPNGAALTLLKVMEREPEAVLRALQSA